MTAQLELFEYIKSLTGLKFTAILPKGEGFAAQIAPSREDNVFFDGEKENTMSVLFLGKSKDQQELINSLYILCNDLTAKQEHPKNGSFEIRCINTATAPTFVCKEDGGFWVWSCVIDVHYLMKGKG